MAWIEKGLPTVFDEREIPGLFFLDGASLDPMVESQFMAMIEFPSGREFELWPSSNPEAQGIVHFRGEFDMPKAGDDRDSAYEWAIHIAEQCGYSVYKEGDNGLEVWIPANQDRLILTYDNEQRVIADADFRGWHD